ncbi:MAG: 16S rRNA (guanine(966)-N(2))-methyltransferase RsmD [Desulfobacterales bacterium]
MQVIGGKFKGRKLLALPGRSIRPTSGKVREAVFNICASMVAGARVADLFAGTGAMGIEALSRGAAHAVFVESDRRAADVIQKNLAACRAEDRAAVFCRNLLGNPDFLRQPGRTFDLVFMDPPYNRAAVAPALENLAKSGVLAPGALAIIEHAPAESLLPESGPFEVFDQRKYGKTLVSFMKYMVASSKSGDEDGLPA